MGQSARTKMRTVIFPCDDLKGSSGLPWRSSADWGRAGIGKKQQPKRTRRDTRRKAEVEERLCKENMAESYLPWGAFYLTRFSAMAIMEKAKTPAPRLEPGQVEGGAAKIRLSELAGELDRG